MTGPLHQWVPSLAGAVLEIVLYGYAYFSTRRLDARIKREREERTATPPAEGAKERRTGLQNGAAMQ